jgi:hypothetical protein
MSDQSSIEAYRRHPPLFPSQSNVPITSPLISEADGSDDDLNFRRELILQPRSLRVVEINSESGHPQCILVPPLQSLARLIPECVPLARLIISEPIRDEKCTLRRYDYRLALSCDFGQRGLLIVVHLAPPYWRSSKNIVKTQALIERCYDFGIEEDETNWNRSCRR